PKKAVVSLFLPAARFFHHWRQAFRARNSALRLVWPKSISTRISLMAGDLTSVYAGLLLTTCSRSEVSSTTSTLFLNRTVGSSSSFRILIACHSNATLPNSPRDSFQLSDRLG